MQNSRGRRYGLSHSEATRRVSPRTFSKLEANTGADFYLPVAAGLLLRRATESAESGRPEQPHGVGAHWIQPLVMVEHVSEHTLKLQANAFRYHNVLSDAEIQIPVRQAKEIAVAAVLVIQTQNRIAEVVNGRYALLEQIDRQGTGGAVVIGVPRLNRRNLNRVFIAKEVDVVPCAVLLAVSGRSKNLDRRARPGREHGREGPSTQLPVP